MPSSRDRPAKSSPAGTTVSFHALDEPPPVTEAAAAALAALFRRAVAACAHADGEDAA